MRYPFLALVSLVSTLAFGCDEPTSGSAGAAVYTVSTETIEAPDRAQRIIRLLRDSSSDEVLVVAHRGVWRYAPENSLLAIKRAIDVGVHIVEIDVRRTKDGRFVVLHDQTLDRTTTGSGRVDAHTRDELKRLKLRNAYGLETDHEIPTLEEALELCRGTIPVYLDKTDDYIDEVFAVVDRMGMADQVLFYGSRPLEALRARFGGVVDRMIYVPKSGDKTPDPLAYAASFADEIDTPVFIHSFAGSLESTLPILGGLRKLDRRVWVSTMWPAGCGGLTDDRALTDPDETWGRLIDAGVSVFCTDRPEAMLEYLERRALRGKERVQVGDGD